MAISEFVEKTRLAMNLNRRKFAENLCEKLDNKHSAQWIKNWEDGKSIPSGDFLGLLLWAYEPGEWQYQFALQVQGLKVSREVVVESAPVN